LIVCDDLKTDKWIPVGIRGEIEEDITDCRERCKNQGARAHIPNARRHNGKVGWEIITAGDGW
jgi:hypothetical protein